MPTDAHSAQSDTPPVDRCPWCEDEGRDVRGTIDYRIKIGGRYVYRCPESTDHCWQDADEKPSEKGFTPVGIAPDQRQRSAGRGV